MGETEVEWVGRWWGNTSHLCYSNTSIFNSSHDQVETISIYLRIHWPVWRWWGRGVASRTSAARWASSSRSLTSSRGHGGSGDQPQLDSRLELQTINQQCFHNHREDPYIGLLLVESVSTHMKLGHWGNYHRGRALRINANQPAP